MDTWWSDNKTLDTVAGPLVKWLYDRRAKGIIAANEGALLSMDTAEAFVNFLSFLMFKDTWPYTRVLIVDHLTFRIGEHSEDAHKLVECGVLDRILQLFDDHCKDGAPVSVHDSATKCILKFLASSNSEVVLHACNMLGDMSMKRAVQELGIYNQVVQAAPEKASHRDIHLQTAVVARKAFGCARSAEDAISEYGAGDRRKLRLMRMFLDNCLVLEALPGNIPKAVGPDSLLNALRITKNLMENAASCKSLRKTFNELEIYKALVELLHHADSGVQSAAMEVLDFIAF
ncbi:hypothetical protein B0H16DRAFT_1808952 [Mycena metata]|uniref:Uncharacterized protein n=1 Tax=Mycena metata TaxID=1033252 RepID=A0AAD7H780_9AGAR|nr:hypothetical protein B0H16DRAFT_1808952 [Mycena metata]